MTPTVFTWMVWACAAFLSFWPWDVRGRHTGSPIVRLVKRAGIWATRER
jgi:hypothetical protein